MSLSHAAACDAPVLLELCTYKKTATFQRFLNEKHTSGVFPTAGLERANWAVWCCLTMLVKVSLCVVLINRIMWQQWETQASKVWLKQTKSIRFILFYLLSFFLRTFIFQTPKCVSKKKKTVEHQVVFKVETGSVPAGCVLLDEVNCFWAVPPEAFCFNTCIHCTH